MLKLRYIFRLVTTFLFRFKGLILASAILGIAIFVLVRFIAPLITRGSTERIGIYGRFRSDSLPIEIQKIISSGLTKIDEDQTPVPDISQSWETSDKGKTWIFTIKDNQYWQDGEPISGKSLVYEFSDVEVNVLDDKTVSFELQEPFAPFPSVVSKPTFRKGLLGTKDWEVENIIVAGEFVQELKIKNSKKDVKIYKFYPTTARTKLAYKTGEVDKIINLIDPTPFDNWENTILSESVQNNKVVTLFFNVEDKILSDKSLRQALTYAINKNSLGARAVSPISPDSWAYNAQVKKYTHDPERAKEIIEGLPVEFKENLDIKLATSPVLLSVAEKIKSDWDSVGIKTTVQVSSVIPSEFQVFLTIFDIPSDPDQYSIWHSTQESTNIAKYKSPRIDKLLEDGRIELDTEERKKIYLDFQRFLIEDSPAAFLYHPVYYKIERK
jgi:peptide/nickel transport system substrate-binding protein